MFTKSAQSLPDPKTWVDMLLAEVGVTTDISQAGYVLQDGTLVNLNRGKFDENWLDHRTVVKYLSPEQKQEWAKAHAGQDKRIADYVMTNFQSLTGAIRINGPMPSRPMPGIFSVELSHKANDAQISTILSFNPKSLYLYNAHGGEYVNDINEMAAYLRRGKIY